MTGLQTIKQTAQTGFQAVELFGHLLHLQALVGHAHQRLKCRCVRVNGQCDLLFEIECACQIRTKNPIILRLTRLLPSVHALGFHQIVLTQQIDRRVHGIAIACTEDAHQRAVDVVVQLFELDARQKISRPAGFVSAVQRIFLFSDERRGLLAIGRTLGGQHRPLIQLKQRLNTLIMAKLFI